MIWYFSPWGILLKEMELNIGPMTASNVLPQNASNVQWPVHPGYLLYRGDEILPSYMGILKSHYKNPYYPIRIPWNVNKILNARAKLKSEPFHVIHRSTWPSRWWQLKDFWNFHPDPWGNDPIWRTYFLKVLKPPRSSSWKLNKLVCFCKQKTSSNLSHEKAIHPPRL